MGTVSHGFLMVPYYQWKLSHRNHHMNTGNIDKDEVFYPVRRSEQRPNPRLIPLFALGFGWFIYLATGYVHFTYTVLLHSVRIESGAQINCYNLRKTCQIWLKF